MQELPFDLRKNNRQKKAQARDGFKSKGINALYGGGTLPKGFEHLEDLRSAQVRVPVGYTSVLLLKSHDGSTT